ncbi:prostatic acid phosphatase-like [Ischnura elegans]|uniref:prostatic acid phosphatase-like n=1 Tax=Ischnura elegans TaxID=197161 RepID=UPI001ED89B28|nr:prostatic acid phosphatase-like [Ischnura elegans]
MDYLWRGILSIIFVGFIHVYCVAENDLSSLELVHIVFRHGDRTPVEAYPNDPYKNSSLWPVGWGQLTNEGKRQHYALGQFFRRRYGKFLSPLYSKDEVHVRSTDVDRTLMSAESNLAGLYPPQGNQIWEEGITWQPIPIHTLPESLDQILAGKKPCPRYEYEFKKSKELPEIKMLNEESKELYKYLTEKTGKLVHDIESVEFLYNTLTIEERFNFTLPEWTKGVYPDKMEYLAAFSFTLPTYTKELQRLKMGPLISEMMDHFIKKKDGTLSPSQRKLFMYSAHDTTIANLLMTFGLFNPPFSPPYTSTILLELHRSSSDNYYVSLLYKNGTKAEEVIELTIPGCVQHCPLDHFVEIMSPLVPVDWKRECSMRYDDDDSAINAFGIAAPIPLHDVAIITVITSAATALLLAVSLIIFLVYWCKRRDSPHWYYKLSTEGP